MWFEREDDRGREGGDARANERDARERARERGFIVDEAVVDVDARLTSARYERRSRRIWCESWNARRGDETVRPRSRWTRMRRT